MLETFGDFVSLAVILLMLVLALYCFLVLTTKGLHQKLENRHQRFRQFLSTFSDGDTDSESKEFK